jgi:hypothetical protein
LDLRSGSLLLLGMRLSTGEQDSDLFLTNPALLPLAALTKSDSPQALSESHLPHPTPQATCSQGQRYNQG